MKKSLNNLVLITQLGISVLTPIGLGLFIGIKIDEKFNKNGLFTLILLLMGTCAGFMNLLKMTGLIKTRRNNNNAKEKEDE